MVFEICHLDNSRILLLICEQRVWTIDCRGSFIPGCRLSSMHHEHLVSDHSRFKNIPPTIEMYFCKLHQKQHIKPDRKEGGREYKRQTSVSGIPPRWWCSECRSWPSPPTPQCTPPPTTQPPSLEAAWRRECWPWVPPASHRGELSWGGCYQELADTENLRQIPWFGGSKESMMKVTWVSTWTGCHWKGM